MAADRRRYLSKPDITVVVRMQKYTDIVYSARNFLRMSSQQVRVASLLLEESFGELVEKVGGFLLRHGASSLAEIIRGTELKPNQVAAATIDTDYNYLIPGTR